MVETVEIEGEHGIPKDATSLANELQQVLHRIVKIRVIKEIKSKSAYRYDRRVIERVNIEEGKVQGQKITSRNGMIKVSSLSHKRAK